MKGTRGRSPVLPVVVIAASVVAMGTVLWYFTALTGSSHTDGFLRLKTSPTQTVWLQFRGDRVRSALAPEKLARARWRGISDDPLPQPKSPAIYVVDAVPSPSHGEGEAIYLVPRSPTCEVEWHLERRDKARTQWRYASTSGSVDMQSGDPTAARLVTLPMVGPLMLDIVAQPRQEGASHLIGININVRDGDFSLQSASRGGKDAVAHVRVLDAKGEVVAEKTGPLSDFAQT